MICSPEAAPRVPAFVRLRAAQHVPPVTPVAIWPRTRTCSDSLRLHSSLMSRLDDSVSIETYELEFSPDLKAHTFRGRGKYSVTTTAPASASATASASASASALASASASASASFSACASASPSPRRHHLNIPSPGDHHRCRVNARAALRRAPVENKLAAASASWLSRGSSKHASGCPERRPASANQPLGPRLPAISALFST